MNQMNNEVGVAIIFFNRPDLLRKVFDSVRQAKPKRLFLIQDGPRSDKDIERIEECRKIFEKIDWECVVQKNYSDINQGCGKRMSSGISWAFETVEKLIILEDDCVPNRSFYTFCDEMLLRYENDERILMISGLNHWGAFSCESDYLFAINGAIWGWATWKRAWNMFDFAVSAINKKENIQYIMSGIEPKRVAKRDIVQWQETNRKVSLNEKLSYWAHQWRLVKIINFNLCIIPSVNLICNMGDVGATHVFRGNKRSEFHYMTTEELSFPLKHPEHVYPNREYDDRYYREFYPTLIHRILKKIKRIIQNN